MLFINKFFSNLVSKNIKFKDKYINQSCYIIGNGQSIKYFDLKKFSKNKTLTCGWMFLHKDYKNLDVIADIHFHPGIFSVGIHTQKKIELNKNCRNFLNKSGRLKGDVNLFTSVYHYPFLHSIKISTICIILVLKISNLTKLIRQKNSAYYLKSIFNVRIGNTYGFFKILFNWYGLLMLKS